MEACTAAGGRGGGWWPRRLINVNFLSKGPQLAKRKFKQFENFDLLALLRRLRARPLHRHLGGRGGWAAAGGRRDFFVFLRP